MQESLETLIRELESKLPDLRRLIAESEITIATSEEAQETVLRLGLAIRLADAEVSQLRRELLVAMQQDSTPEIPVLPNISAIDDVSDAARELERILEG